MDRPARHACPHCHTVRTEHGKLTTCRATLHADVDRSPVNYRYTGRHRARV